MLFVPSLSRRKLLLLRRILFLIFILTVLTLPSLLILSLSYSNIADLSSVTDNEEGLVLIADTLLVQGGAEALLLSASMIGSGLSSSAFLFFNLLR